MLGCDVWSVSGRDVVSSLGQEQGRRCHSGWCHGGCHWSGCEVGGRRAGGHLGGHHGVVVRWRHLLASLEFVHPLDVALRVAVEFEVQKSRESLATGPALQLNLDQPASLGKKSCKYLLYSIWKIINIQGKATILKTSTFPTIMHFILHYAKS